MKVLLLVYVIGKFTQLKNQLDPEISITTKYINKARDGTVHNFLDGEFRLFLILFMLKEDKSGLTNEIP